MMVGLASWLGAGCVSSDSAKFENQVHHWVPLGTTVAAAQTIMEQHHFDCQILNGHSEDPLRRPTLSCKRRPGVWASFGDWMAEFVIEDGKVAGYGYIDL